MTNNDSPKRIGVEGHWVQFIDRQGNEGASGKQDEGHDDRLTHCDVTSDHLEDLEVDSMLRQLARCESEEPGEFADDVLAQLGFHTTQDGKRIRSRDRLPVPDPIFETEPETDSATPPASQVARGFTSIFTQRSRTLKSVTIVACLMLAILVGVFSMNDFGDDDPHRVASESTGDSTARADHPDEASKSDNRTDPDQLANAETPKNADPSNPTEPVNDETDQTGVAAPQIAKGGTGSSVGLPPTPNQHWTLAIDFDEYGMGKMRVNDKELPTIAFRGNTRTLLNQIGNAVEQRFQMLQPRLGSEIGGTISINRQEFPFPNPSSMERAVRDATRFANEMELKPLGQAQLLRSRTQHIARQDFRKFVADDEGSNASSPTRFGFATLDEAASIQSAITVTEQFLRGWAVLVRDWKKENQLRDDYVFENLVSPDSQSLASISHAEFNRFVDQGLLNVPDVAPHALNPDSRIQRLSNTDLRSRLRQSTRAFDLFRDRDEFLEAERFVRKNDRRGVSANVARLKEALKKAEKEVVKWNSQPAEDPDVATQLKKAQDEFVKASKALSQYVEGHGVEPLKGLLADRPELNELPLVMGDDCYLDSGNGESLKRVSENLGRALANFDGFASRDKSNNDTWRYLVLKNAIDQGLRRDSNDQILRTMDQILQIDHPRLRMELIEFLRDSGDEEAIDLLARRAKYDLAPEIRYAATEALAEFDAESTRKHLLEGLKYPWAPVAQHAAEALVQLKDDGAIDSLVQLLREPSPTIPVKGDDGQYFKREVVAINHLNNCLLCHAPSTGLADNGRALIPNSERPLTRSYYEGTNGAFVRADTTYLRQDFSVMQPVSSPREWPEEQRFDYVVVNRKLTNEQARSEFANVRRAPNIHREAVLFALRKLTGETPKSDSYAAWAAVAVKYKKEHGIK